MVIVDVVVLDATLKNLSMISRCCSAYVSFVSRLWGFDQLVLSTSISFATEAPIVGPLAMVQASKCSRFGCFCCMLISTGVSSPAFLLQICSGDLQKTNLTILCIVLSRSGLILHNWVGHNRRSITSQIENSIDLLFASLSDQDDNQIPVTKDFESIKLGYNNLHLTTFDNN